MRSPTFTMTSKEPPPVVRKKSELRSYLGQQIRLKSAMPIVVEPVGADFGLSVSLVQSIGCGLGYRDHANG